MTSTFSSMIQRMRGNRGKEERFKFLWNELPDEGEEVERGRHRISHCVPLDKSVMIETGNGPYSWNRVSGRLNVAWMREWPESFLHEDEMVERARGREVKKGSARHHVSFLGDVVAISSNDAEMVRALGALFAPMIAEPKGESIAHIYLQVLGNRARLLVDGVIVAEKSDANGLLRRCYREVVKRYVERHPDLVWMHAGCAATGDDAVILPGDWGRGKTSLVLALCDRGWLYFSDDVAPVDAAAVKVLPFPAMPQMRASTPAELRRSELGNLPKAAVILETHQVARDPKPLSMIVLPFYRKGAEAAFVDISPAEAVGELLESCLSFTANEDASVQRLCVLVETFPVQRLVFDKATEAADLLIERLGLSSAPSTSSEIAAPETTAPEATAMADNDTSQDITVDVTLVGGITHRSVLPSNSQILHDLHVALASGARQPGAHDSILQLPVDGGHAAFTFMASSIVSVISRPPLLLQPTMSSAAARLPGQGLAPSYLRIEDFLTPAENEGLLEYAIGQEPAYDGSTTVDNRKSYRRSKVLHAVRQSRWDHLFMSRLKMHLPYIAAALGKPNFELADYEMQLTASNDGDFFKAHPDWSPHHSAVAREITFVYYLHRTPRPYGGGGLLFYEGTPGQPIFDRGANVMLIDPQNNCLIAFASERWHEVDMVRCPSRAFADSRFTVNGWLRQTSSAS